MYRFLRSLHIYTFVVSRAFMAGAASQEALRRRWLLPGTWSHLWFTGVHECPPWCSIVGATVIVHQFFCILHYGISALVCCWSSVFVMRIIYKEGVASYIVLQPNVMQKHAQWHWVKIFLWCRVEVPIFIEICFTINYLIISDIFKVKNGSFQTFCIQICPNENFY